MTLSPLQRVKHNKYQQLRQFGVSLVWYLAQYEHQAGKCAVCRQPETALSREGGRISPRTRSLAVDHDHVTGKVRSLLCGRCNLAAGYGTARLEGVVRYLEAHQ